MTLLDVSLADKYDLENDRIFVSGTQALVRLVLMQKNRDRLAGLNTGGYISGYRGSPLGGLDQQFERARDLLEPQDIKFRGGLNEDLAATAIWGTQQAELRGDGRLDGVFAIWYGKGPGVDRAGDVFRHANLAGTSKHGGVLALMGDDHTCESSTTAHSSEYAMMDASIPIFNPAGVQDYLEFGLMGWGLSRYSGLWVGMKCVKETVESTASVITDLSAFKILIPTDFVLPDVGLNIHRFLHPVEQEALLYDYKVPAAQAFLELNSLDRIIYSGGSSARLGIIAAGKSYLDVLEAFENLGIDAQKANQLGIRLYKLACTWPIEKNGLLNFSQGLETIVVVEEKRSFIETQIRNILYGTVDAPVIVGKVDEKNAQLFQAKGALDINQIALGIGERITRFADDESVARRIDRIRQAQGILASMEDPIKRVAYFCAGCPHNTSTKVPDGHRAYAGIGCHFMALGMDRNTEGFTHMGGEGANWIGEACFSNLDHVFQNLGDGTYNHSGYLAIRAASASGVNITYKILFNDAVAMTGGQKNDGDLTVDAIARQVAAEGALRIVVVTDEPDKYDANTQWPAHTNIHHRKELDKIQRELATVKGLSVLIYDQTCAAEKRRRRKRGLFPEPDKRIFINSAVCEGCGDCGVQSNCVAIVPKETVFGRKRMIDQSSCNKDFSCIDGFCPSFVTVHGAKLRKGTSRELPEASLNEIPQPDLPELSGSFGIIVTGIGGTGVVTIGAIIGMAAHLEGKGCGVIDMAGLAQKGGAVTSHLRLAANPGDIHAIRIPAGGADLVLGCDMVVAASSAVMASIDPGRTKVIVNLHETMTGAFAQNADFSMPVSRMISSFEERVHKADLTLVEAQKFAQGLFGDTVATNMFMLGIAWQKGGLPLSQEALFKAIELNGVAVEFNKRAFAWGRMAAHDPSKVEELIDMPFNSGTAITGDDLLALHVKQLTAYQDRDYAAIYSGLVKQIATSERALGKQDRILELAAARALFKLMMIKDEYEVGRLYSEPDFLKQLGETFSSWDSLEFHLAPPALAKIDKDTGRPDKIRVGQWVRFFFGVLSRLRKIRGTKFDVFGYSVERKSERDLRDNFYKVLQLVALNLKHDNIAVALKIFELPLRVRGFGPVKKKSMQVYENEHKLAIEIFQGKSTVLAAE